MRHSVVFLLGLSCLTSASSLSSQSQKSLEARELLNSTPDKVLSRIERLSKEETKELISQVRQIAKQEYAGSESFYFLISHLEEMQAIQKEQERLQSVFWVFGLGFLLFGGFVLHLIFRMNRISREIQTLK